MSESELVQELRTLAGVSNQDTFELRHDGVRIHISYSGGSSSRLVMRVRYDEVAHTLPVAGYRGGRGLSAIRPMKISLRPEREVERQGKESGMDIELQTGDPSFDDAVYVDTPTPADVSIHVLGPDVRRAVLDLFAIEFTSITIDDNDGNVVAEIVSFAKLEPPSHPGARAVDAFARLSRALPRVDKAEGVHSSHPLRGWSTLLGVMAFVLFLVSFPIYFVGAVADQCDAPMNVGRCFGPGLAGIVVGLVAAVVVGIPATSFTRRFRGRSDSSRTGGAFAISAAALAFLLVANVVALLVARM